MSNPTILVTGATGKTGSAVVEQLLERGYPVRALIRRHDDRSARLETLGAEIVLGDFLASLTSITGPVTIIARPRPRSTNRATR